MRETRTFDEFYLVTRERTVHQMYAMIGDLGEAEDVTQEAYGRAWRRWEQVATETGASVSAVKSRLARGRAVLATLLNDASSEDRYV